MPYYDDDHMLMLSGIQHYMYCPRQWALIHIEQQWGENRLTAEGQLLHENVDNPAYRQKNGDVITLRSVHIASYSLGLYGISDAIIDNTADSVRFYFLGNNWQRKIETLGKITSFDPTEALII